MMQNIERAVTTLRTADESFSGGNSRAGMQTLELAKARLDRLAAQLLPEQEGESPPDSPPQIMV